MQLKGNMRITGFSERSGHTSMFTRVLILTLLSGGILLQGSTLGYAFNGTAVGFFGGVDVSGWFSTDFSTSNITVSGPPGSAYPYVYTFSGPLNGPGYTQVSQIPPTPCVLSGCPPGGFLLPGNATVFVAPTNNALAGVQFGDTGEVFTGAENLTDGWILNDFQGGPSSAPTSLNSPGLVAEITGSLTDEALQDYYDFKWLSGAFSVTASVPDAPSGASYAFSVGVEGTCTSGGTATLNSSDSFTSTIAIANLASGQYCVGIATNSSIDPAFALTFNTPVTSGSAPSSVPEPSSLVLLSIGLLVISWRLLAQRGCLHFKLPGSDRSVGSSTRHGV
jgi:hypothetical protein